MTAAGSVFAQETLRAGYFLEDYKYRHTLNPAFGNNQGFVAIPVLGNFNVAMMSNVGVNTFLYKMPNGQLTTFMNNSVDANTFLGKLNNINKLNVDFSTPIIAVGFKGLGGYNTVTIGVRTEAGISLPKDLFTFMKLGMTSDETKYNFKNLSASADAYAEIALGHSHQVNERLRLGGTLKVLLGAGHASAKISNMDVTMSGDKWEIDATGKLEMSAGEGLYVPTKAEAGKVEDKPNMANNIEWGDIEYNDFHIAGWGLALDGGAVYKVNDALEVSASVTDFGFITWNNTYKGHTDNNPWVFDGFHNIPFNSDQPDYDDNKLDQQVDDLLDDLQDLVNFNRTQTGRNQARMLTTNIHLGGEYKMPFYNKLSASVLYTAHLKGPYSWNEGRIYANVSPVKWFNASINYGISEFGSSMGWILNFHPKGFNVFIGSDHQFFNITPQVVPVGHANMSVSFGFNAAF